MPDFHCLQKIHPDTSDVDKVGGGAAGHIGREPELSEGAGTIIEIRAGRCKILLWIVLLPVEGESEANLHFGAIQIERENDFFCQFARIRVDKLHSVMIF